MSKQVLVIDDSQTVCAVIKVCLHRAGYEVTDFPDGVKAIEWLQGGAVPDLILVDICLPKMDGYSVVRYLRERPGLGQIPFVIMSRRDGLIDKLKARLVGATMYLVKPLKQAELVKVVQGYLGSPVPEGAFHQ